MKTILLNTCTLALTATLATSVALAEQDYSNKQFLCRSTCAAFDASQTTLVILGSVQGTSEVGEIEAFADMQQNCENLTEARKMDSRKSVMIKGKTKISNRKVESSTHAESIMTVKKVLFQNSTLGSTAAVQSTQQDYNCEIELEDGGNCRLVEVNPNGKHKYIGKSQPLG